MAARRWEDGETAPIVVPVVDRPAVSVLIVTYGGFDLVAKALRRLVANTPAVYEVIVVDNASPDATAARLGSLAKGGRLIAHPSNIGFAAANNLAALYARGDELCLLNSDCFVLPRWLDPLRRALARPGVGAVTPLMLHLDGTVQESGSIIGAEGGTYALGDGDPASSPGLLFARDVDYASAACLLMRRSTFHALGGLDVVFGRGYYEDVDMLLRLRRDHGLLTLVEPASRVEHRRGGSFSTRQADRLAETNRRRIRSRHPELFARRPAFADLPLRPYRRVISRDADRPDRVLVIDDRIPHWDRGSGDPRMLEMLRTLAAAPTARVTLLPASPENAQRYAPRTLGCGVEVIDTHDPVAWLAQRRFHYSVVVVSRPRNFERFGDAVHASQPQAIRVYDAESFYHRRLLREAERCADARRQAELYRSAQAIGGLERRACLDADIVTCVSNDEAGFVKSLDPSKPVFEIPGVVPAFLPASPFEQRDGIVFYGGFMAGPGGPNEDAAVFAATEIMPRVRAALPDVRLQVIGADPTPAVRALADDGVKVIGRVSDPRRYLDQARLLLVPLRFGAGVKNRFLDAMAVGLPFVTTACGVEGLGLDHLASDIVAESPAALAALTIELYSSPARWREIQDELSRCAEQQFGCVAFHQRVSQAFAAAGIALPFAPAA